MNLFEIKRIIENNPIAFATVSENYRPNVIAVASAKVVFKNQLLITDVFMKQTKKNILGNKNVCLAVWNKNWQGYKLIGRAEYFARGKWKNFVDKIKENKNEKIKGAILVKISKISPLH
ncbi:MAG: pyridoxamine 5'-phosphate oxidase family protein [Patescibacteria group bacterium]